MIRVGCSGWSYTDWRGVVYPSDLPQRRWLQHYQELFDTVELNSTFYRLQTPGAVEAWAAAAPAGLLFAFKLGTLGSHRKKLRDPESWLPTTSTVLVALVNISDRRSCNSRRGGNATPNGWTTSSRRCRHRCGVRSNCAIHHGSTRTCSMSCVVTRLRCASMTCSPSHPFELTTDWTHIRFHRPDAINTPYHGAYGEIGLRSWIERLQPAIDAGHDIYAYFNNDWYGHAVNDAMLLRPALQRTESPGPRSPTDGT